MDSKVEIAVLKTEIRQGKEERKMIVETLKEMQGDIKELNLSMAKYKGMIGIIMIVGTLLVAGAKFALSYFLK